MFNELSGLRSPTIESEVNNATDVSDTFGEMYIGAKFSAPLRVFVPNLNKIEAKIFRKKKNRQFEETEIKTKLID